MHTSATSLSRHREHTETRAPYVNARTHNGNYDTRLHVISGARRHKESAAMLIYSSGRGGAERSINKKIKKARTGIYTMGH
jgi:hypothetical protein